MRRGEIELLKPEYRLALARDGYALVKCESRGVQAGGLEAAVIDGLAGEDQRREHGALERGG